MIRLQPISNKASLLAAISLIFSSNQLPQDHLLGSSSAFFSCYSPGFFLRENPDRVDGGLRRLAGPYAVAVKKAAEKAHVPPKLVAAVAYVENGGDFHGSATRVSPAGAIGVMQLMPGTAWGFLHVNPWSVRQNIEGAAKYLAYLLHQFHGDQRLAVMAYNAGPTAIAHGYRPLAAVTYAQEVLQKERLV